MDFQDFKHLLLNRNEIERALGINLTQALSADEQYLNDYAMFSVILLEDVTAIFLGLNPANQTRNRQHPRYWTIFNAVETAVRRGEINAEITQDFDINGNEIQFDISLTHDTAKAWAKTHGLNWNVPPYKKIHTDGLNSTAFDSVQAENASLKAQLAQQTQEIEDLRFQLENLKKTEPQQVVENVVNNAVDYNNFTIYGHTSELLEILFKTVKEHWLNYDKPPKNEMVMAWIKKQYPIEKYPYVSQAVRQYITTIIRPQPKLK